MPEFRTFRSQGCEADVQAGSADILLVRPPRKRCKADKPASVAREKNPS